MSEEPANANWRRFLCSPQAFVRLAVLTAVAPLLGLLGGYDWFLDLFNHLQAQYFVALLLIALVLAFSRKPRACAIAVAALVIPGVRLAPLYLPSGIQSDGPTLRVASFNVLSANDRYADTMDWILQTDPDFIYLPECDSAWVKGLTPLNHTYPFEIDEIIEGNFGYNFRSKHPILSQKSHPLGKLEVPLLEVVVETPHGKVTVFGAHPVPPVNEFWALERNHYLAELHRLSSATEGHAVILGDFNATRWSHQMKPLLKHFNDTQEGHGYSATWMRNNWLIAIPIDHILARGFQGTISRTTGPDLGSDHRPVIAELSW